MFVDDLIIVSGASYLVARGYKTCLNIYTDLTGQTPSEYKSTVHFPSWANKKICRAISTILGMKIGRFPFKYLGALIGPKRVNLNCFQPLITRAQNYIKAWNLNKLSLVGRAMLINSVLMLIITYQLSCFDVPDSILDQISKIARKILWGGSYNRSDFTLWDRVLLHLLNLMGVTKI